MESESTENSEVGLWSARNRQRAGTVGRFLGSQILIQAIGFAGGLLIVRTVSKEEYGVFTLASSFQSSMLAIAEGGIPVALMAVGGRVWQDRDQLGQVFDTAMELRRRMGWIGAGVGLPILLALLLRNGAGWGYSFLIAGAVLGLYVLNLTGGLLAILPKLHARLDRIQALELKAISLRTLWLLAALTVGLNGFWAIASMMVLAGVQLWGYSRWRSEFVTSGGNPAPELQRDVHRIYRQALPQAIFFAVFSQVGIWLIGWFGNVNSVADVGALGRLAALTVAWDSVQRNVFFPYFAKLQDRAELRVKYFWLVGAASAPLVCLLVICGFAPGPLLWILGPQYLHLQREVLLMGGLVLCSCLQSSTLGLNLARGWVLPPAVAIGFGILAPIALIPLLDLSTVSGVLMLSAGIALAGVLENLVWAFLRLRDEERIHG